MLVVLANVLAITCKAGQRELSTHEESGPALAGALAWLARTPAHLGNPLARTGTAIREVSGPRFGPFRQRGRHRPREGPPPHIARGLRRAGIRRIMRVRGGRPEGLGGRTPAGRHRAKQRAYAGRYGGREDVSQRQRNDSAVIVWAVKRPGRIPKSEQQWCPDPRTNRGPPYPVRPAPDFNPQHIERWGLAIA
jgi:hypothetical protein